MSKKIFTDIGAIADFLKISEKDRKNLLDVPFKIPLHLAEKISKDCLSDPIFLQFIPLKKELEQNEHFEQDPLQEKKCQNGKFLQKYQKRALLLCSSNCVMNCRYCFRKYQPLFKTDDFSKELETIRADTTLEEIILSGGDPLSLTNQKLAILLSELQSISHVKRIRFHTRYPIGDPDRIDPEFLRMLKNCKKQIYFVLQINHIKELDKKVLVSLKKVQKLKIPIMSQSVLLKGINDSFESLFLLFDALANNGIIPYYLHQLDRIAGGAHFEVSLQKGKELMQELGKALPGYALPKYVKEVPGAESKTII